jgi:hypothetical protein
MPHVFAACARVLARVTQICCLVAVVLIADTAATAHAAAIELPAGWTIDGDDLVWTSAAPLRMGGARYEFRSHNRLLGYPAQRGNSLRLPLRGPGSLVALSVWASDRRIDVSPPRLPTAALPAGEPGMSAVAAAMTVQGPYRTQRLQYVLPALTLDGYPAPIEVVAEVTTPVAVAGPRPMVLFLHGRHGTCYRGGPAGELSSDWPCAPGWRPVPSHQGYRYITDVLASQGYLTVSIAANGINAQDGLFIDGGAAARSQLIRHHLALWNEWATAGGDPWGGRFLGGVDLHELVLVGHSRGGEGVERAAIDSDVDDPWQIKGLALIGPTAFGRQVTPGVHTTVLLPFCDGDVTSLEGQQYVDGGRDLTADRALRSSVMAMGTNHNFYNTEWTPGLARAPAWDDWFDPGDGQCGETGSRRLTAAEQQAVGLAYVAALVDLAVGNGSASLPFLDGRSVRPSSIGRAQTFVHAIGGDRQLLYAAGAGTRVTARDLTATECRGYYFAGPFDLRAGCTPDLFFELLPHWLPMSFMETAAAPRALAVAWQRAGGGVQIPVNRDLSNAIALDLRVAGEPGAPPVELTLRVRDALGLTDDLPLRPQLFAYRGPSPLGKVMARQLRASLRGSAIDLRNVTSIELLPGTSHGRFWLLDVSASGNAFEPSEQKHLPRVSVGDVVVPEGDAGEITVDVPITIEGEVTRRATLWVQLTDFDSFVQPRTGFPLVLEPGATSASIPVTYRADDVYNPFLQLTQVTLLARRNAVTGDYDASVLVEEDDPIPRLTVDANEVTATEGTSLQWTFRLSEPMAGDAFWSLSLLAPDGSFVELDSDDVPRSFLELHGIEPPSPAVPLSELGLFFGVEFARGTRVATVTIPITRDGRAEPREVVTLRLEGFEDPVVPRPIDITGIVPPN